MSAETGPLGFAEINSPGTEVPVNTPISSSPLESRERSSEASILTPYQFSNLLLFQGPRTLKGRPELVDFESLKGFITDEEKEILAITSQEFAPSEDDSLSSPSADSHHIPPLRSFKDISDYLARVGHPQSSAVLRRLDRHIRLKIIEKKDIYTEDGRINEKTFAKLPLLAQFGFTTVGQTMGPSLKDFLTNDGILVFTQCKKPTAEYIEAIDSTSDTLPLSAKVNMALTTPSKKISEVSHGFANFLAITPAHAHNHTSLQPGAQSPEVVAQNLNRKINSVETELAQITLLETIMKSELKGAQIAMGASALMILPLLALSQGDSILAEALIKFIPPTFSDLTSLFAQQSAWLQGDTFPERLKDFGNKLKTSHRGPLMLGLGVNASGTAMTEVLVHQNPFLAAVAYSAMLMVVSGAGSIKTFQNLSKTIEAETKRKPGALETIKHMYGDNPAHAGIDIGSVATFATGVAVFGFLGQLNNPVAVSFIEGSEEHAVASAETFRRIRSKRKNFEKARREDTKKWLWVHNYNESTI